MLLAAWSHVKRGRYLGRPNRFTVRLAAERGGERLCHLHDPGRLRHLLAPGAELLYVEKWRPGRRTGCDIVAAVEPGTGTLVLEDTRLGNRFLPLVAEKLIPGLEPGTLEPERTVNGFRADYVAADKGGRVTIIEVKSTNLARGGAALFPDAPSRRAVRQLEAMAAAAEAGARAVLVFTVLRGDAELVKPNRPVDPVFAARLCALSTRLEAYAYRVEPRLHGDRLEAWYGGEAGVEPCG